MDALLQDRRLMVQQGGGEILPSEYQKVEWLQGNGGYIETGYVYKNDPTIDFGITRINNVDADIIGSGAATNNCIILNIDGWGLFVRRGYTFYSRYYGIISSGEYAEISVGKNTYKNGVLLGENSEKDFSENTFSIKLFKSRGIDSVSRLHYVRIIDGGVLVRNFIPCYKKEDNVAGMYDVVGGRFYTNNGSGSFIVGADV